jgi:hypothetical protein
MREDVSRKTALWGEQVDEHSVLTALHERGDLTVVANDAHCPACGAAASTDAYCTSCGAALAAAVASDSDVVDDGLVQALWRVVRKRQIGRSG